MLPDGAVAVADLDNHCIRLILASGGGVLTLAGRGGEEGSEHGPGAVARFSNPTSIVVIAEAGDYYLLVADYGNNKIRRISAGGFVTTYAGSGTAGGAAGSGSAASFDLPYGLALGPGGVLVPPLSRHEAHLRHLRVVLSRHLRHLAHLAHIRRHP